MIRQRNTMINRFFQTHPGHSASEFDMETGKKGFLKMIVKMTQCVHATQ